MHWANDRADRTTSLRRSISTVDGWSSKEFARNVPASPLDRKRRSKHLRAKEKHRSVWLSISSVFTSSESLPEDDDRSACRSDLGERSNEVMRRSRCSPTSLHFRSQDHRVSFDSVWSPTMDSSDWKRSFGERQTRRSSLLPMIIGGDTSTSDTLILSLRRAWGDLTSSRWIRFVSTRFERMNGKILGWWVESY